MRGGGGARVGAGRKPKPRGVLLAMDGTRRTDGLPPALQPALQPPGPTDEAELCAPPADLPAAQRPFWTAWAPLAIACHTLTPATVPGFRLLCELAVTQTKVAALIDAGALGGLRIWLQVTRQVENLLARYCLTSFGKPVTLERKQPAVNPWARLTPLDVTLTRDGTRTTP